MSPRGFGGFRDLSLATKLTVPFAVAFVVLTAGMAAVFIGGSRSSLLESLESRTAILVRPMAIALSDPVVTRDRQRTQELVDEARKADHDVRYAIVVDVAGVVLASSDPALMGQTLKRDDFERAALNVSALTRQALPGKSDTFEMVAPINYAVLGKVGVLRVGVTTDGVSAAVMQATIRATVAALVALLVGVGVCVVVSRRVVKPAGLAARQLRQLASGDADLTRRLTVTSRDEFGQLAESFNLLMENMATLIVSVRDTATRLTSASQHLSSATGQLAQGTQQQAASLEETAASLEEITATVKQNADNARQASQLAGGSRDAADRGGQVVGFAIASMAEITQSSKRIADIITVIDEIAFQTNLLALNAAVEAARAGEQGRGFAVVAAEVRNLAQRSAGAAKEIKALIQDSVSKVEEGSEHVNRSGKTLNEIVESAKRAADIVAEIAAACQEQSAGIDQVNRAVTQMDRVTQDNASQTGEISSTSEALATQASELLNLVGRFRLPDGRGAEVAPAPAASKAARPSVERRRARRPVTDGTNAPVEFIQN